MTYTRRWKREFGEARLVWQWGATRPVGAEVTYMHLETRVILKSDLMRWINSMLTFRYLLLQCSWAWWLIDCLYWACLCLKYPTVSLVKLPQSVFTHNVVHQYDFGSDVVLEACPWPQGASRTNFEALASNTPKPWPWALALKVNANKVDKCKLWQCYCK